MFSAMTTGPETPKTWPKRDSRSSSLTLGRSLFAFESAPAIMEDGREDEGRERTELGNGRAEAGPTDDSRPSREASRELASESGIPKYGSTSARTRAYAWTDASFQVASASDQAYALHTSLPLHSTTTTARTMPPKA